MTRVYSTHWPSSAVRYQPRPSATRPHSIVLSGPKSRAGRPFSPRPRRRMRVTPATPERRADRFAARVPHRSRAIAYGVFYAVRTRTWFVSRDISTGRPCERRDPSVSAIALIAAARNLVLALEQRPFLILRPGVMGPCVRRDDPLRACARPRSHQRAAHFSHMRFPLPIGGDAVPGERASGDDFSCLETAWLEREDSNSPPRVAC